MSDGCDRCRLRVLALVRDAERQRYDVRRGGKLRRLSGEYDIAPTGGITAHFDVTPGGPGVARTQRLDHRFLAREPRGQRLGRGPAARALRRLVVGVDAAQIAG